jgi:hypothetical protein
MTIPLETAADLATYFSTSEFAEAATYCTDFDPDATVTLILDDVRQEQDFGAVSVNGAGRTALVRASEIAIPAKGDKVTLANGDVLTVRDFTTGAGGTIHELDLSLDVSVERVLLK